MMIKKDRSIDFLHIPDLILKLSWSWSYGSLIYKLPMQSVPITTNVMSSDPVHGEVILDTTLCDKVC